MFGKQKNGEDQDWKQLKEVVDSIFTDTREEREKMTRFLKQFQGKIWDSDVIKSADLEESYKSKAHINLVFSTIEAIAPMLTDSRPITHVIPRQPHMEKLAWRYNKGLEYAWDALDMQMNIYKLVLYGMIMKKGILKIYFDPEKRFGGDLAVDVVDPRDFFLAPGYDDIWRAPYCGIKTAKPLSWIRAKFPNVKNVKAEWSTFKDADKHKAYKYGESSNTVLSARFATVYEVWMRDDETMEDVIEEVKGPDGEVVKEKKKVKKYPHGKLVYFTNEQFLGTESYDYIHDLPPYVDYNDYVDPTNFLGMGEIDQIEGLNKELNLQLQAIMDHARRVNNPNYEADVNSFTDIEDLKATFAKGGQIYAVDKTYGSNRPAIEEIRFASLSTDVYNVFTLIPSLVEELSGVTEISKGEASKKERQSASEVAILMESSHTRTRQKVRNLEWTLKRVGYMLVKLMQQYYTEPRTIYTTDSEGMINYHVLGNSLAQAIEAVGPVSEVLMASNGLSAEEIKKDFTPQQVQEIEDVNKLLEEFGSEPNMKDPVLFDFDIAIQTNSTLPMDKQSLSNLMLRLFQMKAVDAEAVLEILQIPNRQEILGRINKERQMAMRARSGGNSPQGG